MSGDDRDIESSMTNQALAYPQLGERITAGKVTARTQKIEEEYEYAQPDQ